MSGLQAMSIGGGQESSQKQRYKIRPDVAVGAPRRLAFV
jgi:hypothetical protein